MGWENIDYSCGHSDRVQLYGPMADRDRKAAWMAKGVCKTCWREQRDTERANATKKAKEQAQESGLPSLVGSDKQIAWAETIRREAIAQDGKLGTTKTAEALNDLPEDKRAEALETLGIVNNARKKLKTEDSAKWWIDNRILVMDYAKACHRAKKIL